MKKINQNIFRAYDIRGVVGEDLDKNVAYQIGRSFGTILKRMNKNKTLAGHDNRVSSNELYKALIKGINESGIDVIALGLITTPMIYFGADLLKVNSYIMVTASHNPKEYNGFKLSYNGKYSATDSDVMKIYDVIESNEFSSGNGLIFNRDIKGEYIDLITSKIKLGKRPIKVVYDCGNGTTSIVADQIFNLFNLEEIGIYNESDGNFPNHHPDPSIEKNLKKLKEIVIKNDADLGVAFDGDGDRVGVVDEKGNMIDIDKYMMIIIRDLSDKIIDNRKILYDVKCSKALEEEIIKQGFEPICYKTGNSYMRTKMVEDKFPFGGELSGHVFFQDRFPGYDDGIYAALRLIEILTNTNQKLSDLLKGINKYYNTRELKMDVPDDQKFIVIEKLKEYCFNKRYHVSTIDGVKAKFKDGSALVRASNTSPAITLRYEAKTEERLEEIKKEFNDYLKKLIK